MKKLNAVLLCAALLLPLAACGAKEPDFRSVYDSEAKAMITLGESRASVEERLGPAEAQEGDWHLYNEGTLTVLYQEGAVATIMADCLPRYEILNYHDGNFLVEVKERFPAESVVEVEPVHEEYILYAVYYNREGEVVANREDAYCSSRVACKNAFSKLVVFCEDDAVYEAFEARGIHAL